MLLRRSVSTEGKKNEVRFFTDSADEKGRAARVTEMTAEILRTATVPVD